MGLFLGGGQSSFLDYITAPLRLWPIGEHVFLKLLGTAAGELNFCSKETEYIECHEEWVCFLLFRCSGFPFCHQFTPCSLVSKYLVFHCSLLLLISVISASVHNLQAFLCSLLVRCLYFSWSFSRRSICLTSIFIGSVFSIYAASAVPFVCQITPL